MNAHTINRPVRWAALLLLMLSSALAAAQPEASATDSQTPTAAKQGAMEVATLEPATKRLSDAESAAWAKQAEASGKQTDAATKEGKTPER